jgi:hypothetical protein
METPPVPIARTVSPALSGRRPFNAFQAVTAAQLMKALEDKETSMITELTEESRPPQGTSPQECAQQTDELSVSVCFRLMKEQTHMRRHGDVLPQHAVDNSSKRRRHNLRCAITVDMVYRKVGTNAVALFPVAHVVANGDDRPSHVRARDDAWGKSAQHASTPRVDAGGCGRGRGKRTQPDTFRWRSRGRGSSARRRRL